MYLKCLEIKGFKSFRDKTVINFLPPQNGRFSVTAIVGPNGAGKSNISDAIKWVMGEQSYKTLRSKKSADIIFAGSKNKGQLSVAEVTMILDNSDKRVLPDYEEISITRRLFRSGESEYIINNNQVKLFDIHLMLAQAQFAQHAYTVVGQGMIDRLLMVSPNERKDFLDEASGIKEYKIKQHQAQLKLDRTKDNVEQAKIMMNEIQPRLRLLTRQVKKLEKRKEIELKLRELQESYYSSLYNDYKTKQSEQINNLESIEKNYRTQFNALQSIQIKIAELAKTASRSSIFDELQVKHQQLVREKNNLERELVVRQGQEQLEYSRAGQQNVSWIKNKVSDLEIENKELAVKIQKLETEKKEGMAKIKAFQKKIQEYLDKRSALIVELTELEKQVVAERSEQNYRQFSGLTAVEAVLDNRSKFGTVYGLLAELAEVEEKYRIALEVTAGGYLSAVVVKDDNTAKKAIEFLRFNHLGTATFLPRNKINPSYQSSDTKDLLSINGVYGWADELLDFEAKFANIFSFVFGRTLVVESIAIAQKVGVGRARMVTLDGDLVEKTGVMRGGYHYKKNNYLTFAQKMGHSQVDLIKIEQDIQRLKEEVETLDINIDNSRQDETAISRQQESIQAKLELLYENQKNIQRDYDDLQRDLILSQADNSDEFKKLLSYFKQKNTQLQEEIKNKEQEIASLSTQLHNFNEQEEIKKKKLFDLQDKMQSTQAEVNNLLSQRNERRVELARLETKLENLSEEVYMELGENIQTIISRGVPLAKVDDLPEYNSKIQKYRYDLSLIGSIDQEVVDEYDTTKEKFDWLSGQIKDLNKAMEDLEEMIVELDTVMKKKSAKAFKEIRKEFKRYVSILFDGGEASMDEVYGYEGNVGNEESGIGNNERRGTGYESSIPSNKGGRGVLVGNLHTPASAEATPLFREDSNNNRSQSKKVVTGIDIMVSPPGKKIKNINTLSGGERTLSSIALICAVLSYNPSPFVVLDEVEAALDEANTSRFSKIVSELSTRAQFIIITHNRVTMHSSDALYGVTMGEDGMSKLLSVKLE